MPCTATAEQIVLAADPWCPYNCEPGSSRPGILVEIAQKAFRDKGYSVRYRTMPWARAIVEARQGRIDGIIGVVPSEAPDFIFSEQSLFDLQDAFFVQAGSPWRYSGIESLQGGTLGVIKDYSYGRVLDDYISRHSAPGGSVQIATGDNGLEINVGKLLKGRITVLIEDRNVMKHYLAVTGRTGRIVEAGRLDGKKVSIAFSPGREKSRVYAEILSDAIIEMRGNGMLRGILAGYALNE